MFGDDLEATACSHCLPIHAGPPPLTEETYRNNEGRYEVPAISDIKAAFHHPNPKEAPSALVKAMEFMLTLAIPAVDPNVMKDRLWTKGVTTHVSFFGSAWKHEMATALLLVEKFSDVNNLLYNAGIVDDKGNYVSCGTDDPVKPAKKKRKKMHTKTESSLLARDYYMLCGYFLKLQKEQGFKERMAAWDLICCGDRGREPLQSRKARVDTMAAEFGHSSDATDYFMDFLRESDLEKAFAGVPSPPDGFTTPTQGGMPSLHGRSTPSATPALASQPESPVVCDGATGV